MAKRRAYTFQFSSVSFSILGTVVLVLSVSAVFLLFWRFGFHSDTAQMALLSKSILERADRSLFMWKAGYQGILLEGYATALMFKIFGVNHYSLNLFNTAALWLVFISFYAYLKKFYDHWISILAVIFSILSTPEFYMRAMRTQPNHTEIYLFGIVLFILSHELAHLLFVQKKVKNFGILRRFILAGFIGGFAFYTYGQIVFFFLAIGLQILLLEFKALFQSGQTIYNSRLKFLNGLMLGHFVFALISFLLNTQEFWILGRKVSYSTVSMIVVSLIYGLIVCGLDALINFRSQWKGSIRLGSLLAVFAFLIGYSPFLYYKYILRGFITQKTSLDGTLSTALDHLKYAWIGNLEFLNIDLSTFGGIVILFLMIIALGSFTFVHLRKLAYSMKPSVGYEDLLRIPALVYLPIVALPIFCVATAVKSKYDARYLLYFIFYYALASSWFAMNLLRKGKFYQVGGVFFLILILTNNTVSLWQGVRETETHGFPGELALPFLEKKAIHFGYADYWLAYGISFHTLENIILEPVESNYCPYYAEPVANARHIAYLDFEPTRYSPVNGILEIHNTSYRVLDAWSDQGIKVYELEKLL